MADYFDNLPAGSAVLFHWAVNPGGFNVGKTGDFINRWDYTPERPRP